MKFRIREQQERSSTPIPKRIAVFGGSKAERGSALYELAREVGAILARAGFEVMSGGYGGAMEAVSAGARSVGGRAIGVTLDSYRVAPNRWINEQIRARTLWQRFELFFEKADGFVVLEGSTGTLAELANALELLLKGLIPPKPLVLLGDFWKPVVELVLRAGEVREQIPLRFASTAQEVADILREELQPHG